MLKSLSRTQSQSFQRLLHQNTTFRIRNEEIRSDEEVARFRPGQWFNDQIINAYGLYLAVRFPDCIIVHTMTTSLLTTNMDGIPSRNFMRNHPLDGKRYVFFPTNLNNTHWVLGVYHVPARTVVIYDSMGGGAISNQHVHQMVRAVETWSGQAVLSREIRGLGIQNDGYNCGPFVLSMMECLCHDKNLLQTLGGPPTTRRSINHFRKRILVRLWQDTCRHNGAHQCRGTTLRGTPCLLQSCQHPTAPYLCRHHLHQPLSPPAMTVDSSDDDEVVVVED